MINGLKRNLQTLKRRDFTLSKNSAIKAGKQIDQEWKLPLFLLRPLSKIYCYGMPKQL